MPWIPIVSCHIDVVTIRKKSIRVPLYPLTLISTFYFFLDVFSTAPAGSLGKLHKDDLLLLWLRPRELHPERAGPASSTRSESGGVQQGAPVFLETPSPLVLMAVSILAASLVGSKSCAGTTVGYMGSGSCRGQQQSCDQRLHKASRLPPGGWLQYGLQAPPPPC